MRSDALIVVRTLAASFSGEWSGLSTMRPNAPVVWTLSEGSSISLEDERTLSASRDYPEGRERQLPLPKHGRRECGSSGRDLCDCDWGENRREKEISSGEGVSRDV